MIASRQIFSYEIFDVTTKRVYYVNEPLTDCLRNWSTQCSRKRTHRQTNFAITGHFAHLLMTEIHATYTVDSARWVPRIYMKPVMWEIAQWAKLDWPTTQSSFIHYFTNIDAHVMCANFLLTTRGARRALAVVMIANAMACISHLAVCCQLLPNMAVSGNIV